MYPYPTYTMPDGTRSFSKPKDGAKFTTQDGTMWTYDGLYEKWMKYANIDMSSAYVGVDLAHPDFEQDMELARKQVCECGAEKVKSSMHSSWCPKHTK